MGTMEGGRWRTAIACVAVLGIAGGCAARRGHAVLRYPDGHLRSRMATRGGQPEGPVETYYPDGHVRSKGTYHDGVPHGVFTYYDPAGRVTARKVFWQGQITWTSQRPDQPVPPRVAQQFEEPAAARSAPAVEPLFASTDWVGPDDQARAELGFQRVRPAGGATATGVRTEVFGQQRVGPLSAYADLAIAHLSDSEMLSGGTGKLVGQLGAIYAPARRAVTTGELGWLVRLGAFFPLGGDDENGYYVTAATMYEHLAGAITAFPNMAGLRASGSLYAQNQRGMFYRLDAGLDAGFSVAGQEAAVRAPTSTEIMARLNGSLGVIYGRRVAVAGELCNVFGLNDSLLERRTAHTAALVLRLRGWPIQPHLGVASPLNPDILGKDIVVLVGVDYLEGNRP